MEIAQVSAARWVRRIALLINSVSAALALCGTVYEAIGKRQDLRRFPRLGRAVQAAGMTFNLNCYGSGSPSDRARGRHTSLQPVFVDESNEDQQRRIDEIVPAAKESRIKAEQIEQRRESQALMLSRFTVPLGIDRLQSAIHSEKPESAFGLSAYLIEEFDYLDRQLKTREAVLCESAAMPESGKMARDSGPPGDRPTIVLTGGKMEFTPDPLFTNDVQEKLRTLWMNVLQVEEAHLSTRGKQVILKDSGHVIQFERPDAVIDSARQVWAEVRAINSSKHRR